ncbi:unnamed protein product [Dracunculus medinensis]|uniref:TIL-like domain-containing protein n=1 Tax=Dracunculus medinensis TaxID=318479 RepID=A0A0N4UBV1_DRAME|nr:unnamed protein product [Dracunculus medinensis]
MFRQLLSNCNQMLFGTIFSIFLQYSTANVPQMKVFELGQIFEDFGCLSTNASCGRNMAFYTIEREVSSNLPMAVKCSQRCSCVDARHFEINGQCTEELPDMNIGSTNTILTSKVIAGSTPSNEESYELNELVSDYECRMVDRSCGKNMVFKELARFNITCVDKCVCANKFVEYNMRCVQYISNELDDKHAGGYHSKNTFHQRVRTYRFGHRIFDLTCSVTGQSCGVNMVFETINHVQQAYCFQECVCDSYSEEQNGQCIIKYELLSVKSQTKILERKGRIGIRCVENGNCKLEEIFHEVECTLRGHPCGPNMQLAIANLSKALEGGTLKCTMKCQCAYGYTEENNQCIRITVDFKWSLSEGGYNLDLICTFLCRQAIFIIQSIDS